MFDDEAQPVSLSFPTIEDDSEDESDLEELGALEDHEDPEHTERRELSTVDGFTPSSVPVLPNLSPAETTNLEDFGEEIWPESDPFGSAAEDDCEAPPSPSLGDKFKLPYPNLEDIQLPSLGEVQQSRWGKRGSPFNSCVGKKRKADDITDDATGQQSNVEQASSHSAAINSSETHDSSLATPARGTESIQIIEPATKKTKLNFVQFTGGMVVGAVGFFAAMLAWPEDY